MLTRKILYLTSSIVPLLLILSPVELALSSFKQNKPSQLPVQNLKVNYPPVCYMRTPKGQLLDLSTLCGRVFTTPTTNIRQREIDFGQEIRVNEISGLAEECYTKPQACFEPPENNNTSPNQI